MLHKIENYASELLSCFRQIHQKQSQYILKDVQMSKTVQELNEQLEQILLVQNNEINSQRLINQLIQKQNKLQYENQLLQKNTNEQVIKENIQLQIQVRSLTDQVQSYFIMMQDYQNQREINTKIQEENSSLLSQLIHYEEVIDSLKKEIYEQNARIEQQKQQIYAYIKEQNALKLSIFDLTQQQQLNVNDNLKTIELETKIQESNQLILALQNENIKLSQLIQQSINNMSKFKIDQEMSLEQVDYLFQQLEQISKENKDLKESINILYRNYEEYCKEQKSFTQIHMVDNFTQVNQDILNYALQDKNIQTDIKIKAINMLSNKDYIVDNLKQKSVEQISQACQTDPLTFEKYSHYLKDNQFVKSVQQTPQIYSKRVNQSSIKRSHHQQDNQQLNQVSNYPNQIIEPSNPQQQLETSEPDFHQYSAYVDQRVMQYRDIIDKFINGLDKAVISDCQHLQESITNQSGDDELLSGSCTQKQNEVSALQQLNFDNRRLVDLLKQLRAQFEMSEEQHSETVYKFQGLQKKFLKTLNTLQKYESELQEYKTKNLRHDMLLSQNQGFISDLRTTLQKTSLQRSEVIRERQKLQGRLGESINIIIQISKLIDKY